MDTVWVFGDQLNRRIASLRGADPGSTRILMVESEQLVAGRSWHRQRLHLYLTAMRRFAAELRRAGFEVLELCSLGLPWFRNYRRFPSGWRFRRLVTTRSSAFSRVPVLKWRGQTLCCRARRLD